MYFIWKVIHYECGVPSLLSFWKIPTLHSAQKYQLHSPSCGIVSERRRACRENAKQQVGSR